jgi:hypothetical protein
VNLRICIAIACIQAAYNNSSEVEVNDNFDGELSDQITQLGEYISGTKIAKQFDGEWWEGAIRKFDAPEDLYWILYTDGDSEEFDADEARQGVQDHKEHMHPAAAGDKVDAADGDEAASDSKTADSTVAVVTQVEHMITGATQSPTSVATSYTLPPEMVTAIAALATAAERLTAAADHLTAQGSQSQQQQQQQTFLQQQQQMHFFHQMSQQQRMFLQQQQQQRALVSLQLQQRVFLQQQQQRRYL